MLSPQTLTDTPNAISSPESADGPLQLDLLAGPTAVKSGLRPARASRTRSPAKAKGTPILGTYGPTFFDSPVPDGPLSSWENRFRQRLARIGSTECDLTWQASPMTDGALLSRLVPSTPRIVEIDSGSLLSAEFWRTPQASVVDARSSVVKFSGRAPSCPQVGLPDQVVATAAMWSTPTVAQPGGSPEAFLARKAALNGACGVSLTDLRMQVQAACWPTPMAGTPAQNGNSAAGNNDSSRKMVEIARGIPSAMWPTATAVDGARGLTTRPQDTGVPLPQRVGLVLGMAPAGSSVTTEKRGVLNPAFPCWLMGYPIEHLSCAVTAMQSCRKSRRK